MDYGPDRDGYDRDGYARGAWRVEDRPGGPGGPGAWRRGDGDRLDGYRREAERRAALRRSRRARIDWRRAGGFAILDPRFTLDDLGPRALSAWLIRSHRGGGDFPPFGPPRRRRRPLGRRQETGDRRQETGELN